MHMYVRNDLGVHLLEQVRYIERIRYYVFNPYDVIFHATSDANDVITADVTNCIISQRSTS